MSLLPLFYRSVVPLDRHAHRAWALAQPQLFAFARASHLVPALAEEIPAACRHLPVVFLPESLGPVPVFLVGAAPGQCALIDEAGAWSGRYVPAYLRRYPFILGEGEGHEPLICVDDESGLVLRRMPTEASSEAGSKAPAEDGQDQQSGRQAQPASDPLPLFGADGAETPLLRERIRLVVDYAEGAKRTARLGRLLQDMKLLRALTIQLQHPVTGVSHTLHGVMGVDETALAALPEGDFAGLRGEGFLPAIYAHLISLQAVADFLVPAAAAGQHDTAAQA